LFSENSITGALPTEFGRLTALTKLEGWTNNLGSSIPTELGLMTALTKIDIPINSITGPIPTEFGRMTALVNVALDQNALTGTLPMELARLTAVTRFEVHTNPGLCGDLVSVGTLGTSYTDGIDATALGTACASPPPPRQRPPPPRPRPPPPSPPPPSSADCSNTCYHANDGECDDGGPGSIYAECAYGTDCGDCGVRGAPSPVRWHGFCMHWLTMRYFRPCWLI
jgi:hypothetical protein